MVDGFKIIGNYFIANGFSSVPRPRNIGRNLDTDQSAFKLLKPRLGDRFCQSTNLACSCS